MKSTLKSVCCFLLFVVQTSHNPGIGLNPDFDIYIIQIQYLQINFQTYTFDSKCKQELSVLQYY